MNNRFSFNNIPYFELNYLLEINSFDDLYCFYTTLRRHYSLSKKVHIRFNNFFNCKTIIPTYFYNFNIKSLEFRNCNLKNIYPNCLYFIKNLKNLYFHNCIFNKFPSVFFKFNIKSISIQNWNDADLSNIINFKYLEVLNLYNIKFKYEYEKENIPLSIFKLNNLKELCFTNSEIKTIPTQIKNLYNLETLDLSNNNIEYIPIEFYSLYSLEWVLLDNNKIDSLSPLLKNFKSLKTMVLHNNKISSLPIEIKNSDAIWLLGGNPCTENEWIIEFWNILLDKIIEL